MEDSIIIRYTPYSIFYSRSSILKATALAISESTGQRVVAIRADVTSLDDVHALRDETLRLFGKIDVLVNSAGWDQLLPFVKTTPDMWDRVIAINFKGVVHTCHAVLPHMSERKQGAIVNMSSDTARVGSFGEAIYAASKAAVDTFTIGLARELAGEGIRVNAVSPGVTRTDIHAAGGDPQRAERLASHIPLGRAAEAEEIAEAVAWLLSDRASYATGTVMRVAGGL